MVGKGRRAGAYEERRRRGRSAGSLADPVALWREFKRHSHHDLNECSPQLPPDAALGASLDSRHSQLPSRYTHSEIDTCTQTLECVCPWSSCTHTRGHAPAITMSSHSARSRTARIRDPCGAPASCTPCTLHTLHPACGMRQSPERSGTGHAMPATSVRWH
jgi:hypothetical protein